MPRAAITSFNSGQLSPLVGARSDTEKYPAGCQQFLNAIPHVQGPASKRPGLQFLTGAGDQSQPVYLFRFVYSETEKVVLEMGETYIRFLTGGTTPAYVGAPLELVTPYTAAELPDVQAHNINDVVIFTHPDHELQKLTRVTTTSWTWEEVTYDYPPLLDPNITSTTLTPGATTGTGISLTASASLFDPLHVGGYFEITHNRTAAYAEHAFTGNGTTTGFRVLGGYSVTSYGTWAAEVALQSSADGTSWETIKSWHSKSNNNINATGTTEREVYLRLDITSHSVGTASEYVRLAADYAPVSGFVKVTGYTSPTVVTVDFLRDCHATTPTTFWAEGAFSPYRGYPRAIARHQSRLVLAGTGHQPNTLYFSTSDDYYNFLRSTLDTGSLSRTLETDQTDPIQWVQNSRGKLLVGTLGQEFVIESGSDDNTITPLSIEARDQTSFGSSHLPAVLAAELVLFVTASARKLREFVYSFESDRFVAPDLNLLSDRLTLQGAITQIAVQQAPHLIIWCITADGRLLGLTYERDQNVAAWHEHTTDGYFESVAVLPGTAPGWDEVYVTVKRHISGADVRYIERLAPLAHHRQTTADTANLEFLDSCLTLTSSTATTAWTGLGHLEGKTVRVLADGSRQPDQLVTAGAITIPEAATTLVAGLPYTLRLQPMAATYDLQDGTSRGRKIRIEKVQFDLLESLGVTYLDDPSGAAAATIVPDRSTADDMGAPVPLFTGITDEMAVSGQHRYLSTFAVESSSPYPVTLRAIILHLDAHGT